MPGPNEVRAFHAQRIAEFRANGGGLKPPLADVPLLILTTIGARSGQARSTPVTYSTDGDRLVIIAANGGATTHPDWYHNLVAHPEVTVEVGTETFQAQAAVATEPERTRLFNQHAARRPNFVEFQRQTARQLPVIVLERVGSRV
jgi:deazaflavin-dependent oxidoreductase (nitroreductase family)